MKRIAFFGLVLALFAYGGLKDVNENDVTTSTLMGDVDGETGTVGDLLSLGISSNDVSGIIGAAIDKGTIATPTDITNATKELDEQVRRDRMQSIAEATNSLADYANVSNKAVNSVQEGSFPLAGIAIDTNGIFTIGDVTPKAEAGRNGVAVGGSSTAADGAVAVGNVAEAKECGVAIGFAASAAEGSVAIGDEAWANNKYSTAIGQNANTVFDYTMALSYTPEQLYLGAQYYPNLYAVYPGKSLQSFLDERVAVSGDNVKSMAFSPAGVLTSVTTTTVTNSATNVVVTVATNNIEFATTDALAAAVADAGKVKSVNGATGDVKIAASDLNAYTKIEVDMKLADAGKVKSVNDKVGDVTLSASDVGAATEADVNSVWGYMKGETFRVVVTNYDSAVNPPRTRYDYRMSTSNEWRTVWTETNGLAWAVSEATNLAAGAAQTMLDKPENRAWGGWDSHTGEAAPDGVVQVSGGGGLLIGSESGWTQINATGGSYWVLTSTDPTLRANGTNGVFQITDPDGKSVMTIKKGDKRLVYADAAGITKSGDTITVKYEVISQTAPTAEVALALDGTWYKQSASGAPFAVSWSGSSGAWVMTATAPSGGTFPTTGFFRAMYETGGDTEVVYDAAIGLTKVSIGGKQYSVGTATVTDASGNTKTVLTLE